MDPVDPGAGRTGRSGRSARVGRWVDRWTARAARALRAAPGARRAWAALAATCLVAATGCASLSASQREAVQTFAGAADGYSALPGGVLEQYARGRLEAELLLAESVEVSDAGQAKEIHEHLVNAYARDEALHAHAREADAALRVVRIYAEMLTALGSDSYTRELQEQATALRDAFESATTVYNERFVDTAAGETPLATTFGDLAAGATRWLGGWYVRHVQARAVERAVDQADPVLCGLTVHVQELLEGYAGPSEGIDSFPAQKLSLVRSALLKATGSGGKLSNAELGRAADATRALVHAEWGARQARQAAGSLCQAHSQLAAGVRDRPVTHYLDAILAFGADVDAGLALVRTPEAAR